MSHEKQWGRSRADMSSNIDEDNSSISGKNDNGRTGRGTSDQVN